MFIKLTDGRPGLFQWDTGCAVEADGVVQQFHFSNRAAGEAYTVNATEDGARWTAPIPDELLQSSLPLRVFAVIEDADGQRTYIERAIPVVPRPKPADYVYEPTDQATLSDLQNQIGTLADLTTADKSTLVAAINEAAASGGTVESVNGVGPDENGNVVIGPTPDDALALLDETGVACAMADEGGAVLTDDADNILIY